MARRLPGVGITSIGNFMRATRLLFVPLALAAVLAGCATVPPDGMAPVALVPHVDLQRYMGDWYVIASIPTFIEKGAHNARESYRLDADGTIPTHFSFNADAADGPVKHYESRAFVTDSASNAVWAVQFIWPFKADYRISYLSPDYTETVVTREKRDNVWIMARTPTISDADLARLTAFVGAQGYDLAKLQRVPQDGPR
jgi:apolipoprotein D and lipocalin family protein